MAELETSCSWDPNRQNLLKIVSRTQSFLHLYNKTSTTGDQKWLTELATILIKVRNCRYSKPIRQLRLKIQTYKLSDNEDHYRDIYEAGLNHLSTIKVKWWSYFCC